ncbi:MAG: NAD(P)-dependent dehydrogenase (short-subunit alcohol dehydrogenase family) [Parvicella sp.]|jgi:NAD(P)-dependent dehydrogenase (short-subunit alcohol dehydrogenase family)
MLKDKVVIVTGSSGLIGSSIVDEIIRNNGIPICADIKPPKGGAKDFFYCDITDQASIVKVVGDVLAKYGKIDGLVNNAYPRTSDWGCDFEDVSEKSLKQNIDWQLTSCILLCQRVISEYMGANGGAIVNIASIYGMVGNDFTIYEGTGVTPPAAYTAIKGGMINFTRYLASRYGMNGVRVNCVSPGGIKNNQPDSFIRAYESKVPMKRMGNPEDISPPVVFLLSNGAQYITGQNLAVDGGWTSI